MEIDITDFVNDEDPSQFSASQAELGANAGKITWRNAMDHTPPMLTTPEHFDALRDWARDSGGWDEEERAAWTDQECNALFVQIISGDLREMPTDDDGEIDWEEAEKLANAGRIHGCIYRSADRVFYYLGS